MHSITIVSHGYVRPKLPEESWLFFAAKVLLEGIRQKRVDQLVVNILEFDASSNADGAEGLADRIDHIGDRDFRFVHTDGFRLAASIL